MYKPFTSSAANGSAPPLSPPIDSRAEYWHNMASPPLSSTRSSMRIRMRKQASDPHIKRHSYTPDQIVSEVKKIIRFDKPRAAFTTNVRLCFRIAMGVLLAGVAQTHAPKSRKKEWYFLPASYYLGGLSWAAMMVIFAASRNIGGAIKQIWQIDVGVAIALLYNFTVFSLIPMNQENLIQVSANFNGRQYDISLQDWATVVPLILVFTFLIFVSPMETNVKKFAVSTNLYFMLTVVSPMNPILPDRRKDLGKGYFGVANLMTNLAVYCAVGVVGTLISLATMILPYPLFAIKEMQAHIKQAPSELREIMNLVVDSYCFRARDIREMDFFRLKLDRLMAGSRARLRAMDELLEDAWWEEIMGGGWYFQFNKTIAKQFVQLYSQVIKDLNAMKFAIELETCHETHTTLMAKLQRPIYLVQVETNDLLDEISCKVLSAATVMPAPRFDHLERNLLKLLKKFTSLYGELLANETIKTADEVACSMPLNLFLYSFHTLVQTLCAFEHTYNDKNYTTKHRVAGFFKHVWYSFWKKDSYPRTLVIFSLRTTLGVAIGLCFSTFVFAFSSTVPNAIAMVAQHYMGGTYGSTVNRLSGLVAGTVVPSIFSFFICKSSSPVVYNLFNNIVLCLWTMVSMYVFYSGAYIKSAGMVSAYMAASVLLEHSCRSNNGYKALSYSSLTENSLGILILIVVELMFRPRSARTLLRANIHSFLTDYGACIGKVFRHHMAVERGGSGSGSGSGHSGNANGSGHSGGGDTDIDDALDAILDRAQTKELRKQINGPFAKQLDEQANLLRDASQEPDLWRPEFSSDKYQKVLDACENLLAHLRILVDLVDWHERRRNSAVDLHLRQNPITGSMSVELTALLRAQQAWYTSQDDYSSAVKEALETLGMLFDEKFSQANADENALFMQMKEAFRLADVDRSGEVDPQELAILLDKLIPVEARGNVRMDQYVAEFLRLVDRNHDGKVSYVEFMDALNSGFRLELEIYEDLRATRGMFRQSSAESLLLKREDPDDQDPDHRDDNHHEEEATALTSVYTSGGLEHAGTVADTSGVARLPGISVPATTRQAHGSLMDKLWHTWPGELVRSLPGMRGDGTHGGFVETPSSPANGRVAPGTPPPPSLPQPPFNGDIKRAMNAALLNVESFSINEAAHKLRDAYGKYLLLQTAEHHVAVEDFIVMSCLICATNEIAARLTTLNTLAAT